VIFIKNAAHTNERLGIAGMFNLVDTLNKGFCEKTLAFCQEVASVPPIRAAMAEISINAPTPRSFHLLKSAVFFSTSFSRSAMAVRSFSAVSCLLQDGLKSVEYRCCSLFAPAFHLLAECVGRDNPAGELRLNLHQPHRLVNLWRFCPARA